MPVYPGAKRVIGNALIDADERRSRIALRQLDGKRPFRPFGADRWSAEASDDLPIDTVFFTPDVVNTPARIDADVRQARSLVCRVAKRTTRTEQRSMLDALRTRDEAWHAVQVLSPSGQMLAPDTRETIRASA
jgi:hypothetical protein